MRLLLREMAFDPQGNLMRSGVSSAVQDFARTYEHGHESGLMREKLLRRRDDDTFGGERHRRYQAAFLCKNSYTYASPKAGWRFGGRRAGFFGRKTMRSQHGVGNEPQRGGNVYERLLVYTVTLVLLSVRVLRMRIRRAGS